MSIEAALELMARGWKVIPLPPRAKKAVIHDWPNLRLTPDEAPQYFTDGGNVGVLLGAPSGDLVDIDLDAPEAAAAADDFLPATGAVFGRASKPRSHRLYTSGGVLTKPFADIDGSMLLEIRSSGAQTMAPGSTHPFGEPVQWSHDGDPARVDGGELRSKVMRLACAALLARHWPARGVRHFADLAAAGLFVRAGVGAHDILTIIATVARITGDDWRPQDVRDTVEKFQRGEPTTGGPRLADCLMGDGLQVVKRLKKWLGAAHDKRAEHEAFNLTDAGNALRFARDHGSDVRFCYEWKCWLTWDGRRWVRDPGAGIMTRAKETARTIYAEAAAEVDKGRRLEVVKWARQSEHEQRLRAMVNLAKSEPGIPIMPDVLDQDPFLLNVENGTVDLRTGVLHAHDRSKLCTKLAPVRFDPAAPCPRFLKFIDEITTGGGARKFLQRALGYSLTGDTREQVFFLCVGGGSNGKSTLLGLVFELLGDYASAARAETFTVRNASTIPNDIARLKGARFVHVSEAEENQRLAESLVKAVTGGDMISGRFLFSEFFDFVPRCKIWIATNHRPAIRGTDHAMWRRVRLIPFDVTIPDDKADKTLAAQLAAEGPGVLAWLVNGCRSWFADGLGVPDAVRDATAAYREEMDVIGRFLRDACVSERGATARSAPLYAAYANWCQANGEAPITQNLFGRSLTERGYQRARGGGRGRTWNGLRLRGALDLADDTPTETKREDDAPAEAEPANNMVLAAERREWIV